MIAKRGENAGKQVVKEAHDRAVREERLIREVEAKKAIEEQRKLAAVAAKKESMEREVHESRQHQLKLWEQLKKETAEEESRFVCEVRNLSWHCITLAPLHIDDSIVKTWADDLVQVESKAKYAAYVEKVNMQTRRLAALQNQEQIKTQIAEKMRRDVLDDTEMSKREKEFMKSELAQAREKVVQPSHINVL